MNSGKKFEQDIWNSIEDKHFKYRLRDSASSWGEGSKTRFTPNNICDFIVYANFLLFLLELKSHKGASIPIAPKTNLNGKITHYGVIKANQLNGLIKEHNKPDVYSGFIFNLSDKEKTWFVKAKDVQEEINNNKKSLSLDWLELYGTLIPQTKKITRYKYDLSKIFN